MEAEGGRDARRNRHAQGHQQPLEVPPEGRGAAADLRVEGVEGAVGGAGDHATMRSHNAVHCARVCAALARFSSCNLGAHLPAKRALITIPKPHMRMPPRPHDAHADGSAATRGLCAPGCAAARNQVVRAWAGAYARAATGLVDALRLAMRKRIAKDAQHQHQQNGDPSQFKRDSRKLYREFDPKKFRKEVLVPKEKMKKMAKSNADNAPSGAPKQNSENK